MLKMFTTIDEVFDWLYNQRKAQKREDLSRITRCCMELDLTPNYKVIHIAGTNGKGSTAASIKSILSLTGMHVGFFVSPFVISFNERIQINDRYISNAEILHYSNILYKYQQEYMEKYKDIIPFFELTLLMALMFFKDRNVDIAIMECGLGGLLDATNFIHADLSIITNIGYDHMAQLGNTLPEIANHKLGIVKDNGHLLTAVDSNMLPQFMDYTKKKNASFEWIIPNVSDISLDDMTSFRYKGLAYKTCLYGEYQAFNAALAIEASKFIIPSLPKDIIDYGLAHIFWPGRMEIIQQSPKIILDGGHNIHAIEHTVNTLLATKKDRKIKVMYTALADKDYTSMIEKLDTIADSYYFTTLEDLRSTNPTVFGTLTKRPYQIIPSLEECLDIAIKDLKQDEILFITGSLHFISVVRQKFLKK